MSRANPIQPTRRAVIRGGIASGALLAAAPVLGQAVARDASTLPAAPRDASLDIHHGVVVPDPFRPLESPQRADVAAWVAAQDARTRAYLDSLPTRAPVQAFLNAESECTWTHVPTRHGSRYFAMFNDDCTRSARFGVQDGIEGPRRTLIEQKLLSADGSSTIAGTFPDRRGARVAYLVAEAGSDKQTLRVRDVDSGQDLPDTLLWCNLSSVGWRSDGLALFYTRVPNETDPADWDRESHIVSLHLLGEPQSADRTIFRLPALRDVAMWITSSHEADLLVINAGIGTSEKRGCYVAPLGDPSHVQRVLDLDVAKFELIADLAPRYYALTRLDAPRGRLVGIDLRDPRPERWRTVIPEGELPLDSVRLLGQRLVVKHLVGQGARLSLHDLDGEIVSIVDLDGPIDASFGNGGSDNDHLLLEVNDYRRPTRIERLDPKSGKVSLFRASSASPGLADAVVRQVLAISKDGTGVPMTLVHRSGIALDGTNRTLLFGYGAFGTSMAPRYSKAIAAWVRLGGIFAVAAIRGGGELGQAWHDHGRLAEKQNSFDDFIAGAEWLIANGYTRPQRLGINGGSAGGLLVLACMLQRPDLFGAVVAEDAPSDMVRLGQAAYMRAVNAEFGDVDVEADFRTVLAYSPLHNVRAGTKYPPLLMMVGDADDRVLPSHAYKLVATLNDKAPESEAYVWVQRRVGHGGALALGKGPRDSIGFLCDKLGGPVLDLSRTGK